MKRCKLCECNLPDDYEDDICFCCYDDMHDGDNDESFIPSISDKEYSEKVLHRRGVI